MSEIRITRTESREWDGNEALRNQRGNVQNLCGNAKNVGNQGDNAGIKVET